jgi:hypothetical protein
VAVIPAPIRRPRVSRRNGPLAYRTVLLFISGAFLGALYGALILAAVLAWHGAN